MIFRNEFFCKAIKERENTSVCLCIKLELKHVRELSDWFKLLFKGFFQQHVPIIKCCGPDTAWRALSIDRALQATSRTQHFIIGRYCWTNHFKKNSNQLLTSLTYLKLSNMEILQNCFISLHLSKVTLLAHIP